MRQVSARVKQAVTNLRVFTTENAGRVLIVVQNLPVPFDRRVWLEATTLAKAGYRVSVICPKAKGFNTGFEILEDVAIYRYPLPIDASSKLGFAAEFLWCLAATTLLSLRVGLFGRGFDVLHACNPPETYWLLGYLWRPFGKVFVFDHHDLSPEMYQAKFGGSGLLLRILFWFERRSFRLARVVITTNESHKAIAIARGGKRAEDIYVVRSGPALARHSGGEGPKSCPEKCESATEECGSVCTQYGGAKGAQMCKKGCGEGAKRCEDKCKKKQR